MDRRIHTQDQLLSLLDDIVSGSERGDRSSPDADAFWSELLRRDGHPLNVDDPDEALLDWHECGVLGPLDGARVLDIGCGAGRNSRWFASRGALVDGIDIAGTLLRDVRPTMPASVTLHELDVLRDPLPSADYDVIHDSGCFHHLAPHRRETYLSRVLPALGPDGSFSIVTFAAESMDDPRSDVEIIRSGDVGGGIGYTLDDLRSFFTPLTMLDGRRVRADRPGTFGADFLVCALFGTSTAVSL